MLELLRRPSVEVAPQLLGAVLHGRGVSVRLTEVEAYLGVGEDPGSHAHRGPTPRTRPMFGEPGHLYVYFSYGMHTCANIVCSPPGSASAVLLRAGEVVDGLDTARERRSTSRGDVDLARGPARLTVALGIALADDGAPLDGEPFALELPSAPVPASRIHAGPRTGVSGDGGTDAYPWRFAIAGDPTVSPYRRSVPKKRG
ncbi:DNA-3-methyladenine glycosylase [Schumannella soli]|uniref:Putative 3-methyladenine DNA glycosylase n=1 Tax=Schumannella soli TaxID=2590779 RepID=A0A506Y3R0_9MICO|nr:DNA-3-methyladenine glycosylase [Schumannella soli]